MADPVYFETGYIVINGNKFEVQEITVNATRDANPYYVAGQKNPLTIRSGRKKIEFTFKRAFSDAVLSRMYEYDCEFIMVLWNADPDTDQPIMTLNGCKLSQDNVGPINGQDVVMEDIQGQAISRSVDFGDIATAVSSRCSFPVRRFR